MGELLVHENDYHWIKVEDDNNWEVAKVKKWEDGSLVFMLTCGSIIRSENISTLQIPKIETP